MLEDRALRQKIPVCVDGRLAASAATGVATYAAAVREALAATGERPLLLDDARRGEFGGGSSSWRDVARRQWRARVGRPVSLVRDERRLHARDVFRLAQARFTASGRLLELTAPGPPGIMHWTYPIPAWIAGWVNLYTIHDAIPLTAPALTSMAAAPLKRRIMKIADVADRFIAVSAAARQEILGVLPIDPPRVVDCGSAVSALDPGSGALPPGLTPGAYYLYCGLAEPRKNLPRLIEAWRASGTERPLVLAGPDHRAIAPAPGVLVLPFQERARLIDLIRGARALLFPSLAEGFGLPVAEAMALGTPVLTAHRGALAETAGGAALLVDPEDGAAIAGGIAALDRDVELLAMLKSRGLDRAAAFTTMAFGRRLRRLHDEFAGDSRFAL
jgi:glycosyltransferase involved in cell wall biosynthesis